MSVWRDCLGTILLAVGCNRPEEGDFQLCDFFPVHGGYKQFRGGATLNTKVQNNDQLRSSYGKHFGRSVDPSLDMADQVLAFTSAAGLVRDPRFRKDQDHSMDCPYWPPLLPLTRQDGRFEVKRYPTSAQILAMIVRALSYVGKDTSLFSGMCARRPVDGAVFRQQSTQDCQNIFSGCRAGMLRTWLLVAKCSFRVQPSRMTLGLHSSSEAYVRSLHSMTSYDTVSSQFFIRSPLHCAFFHCPSNCDPRSNRPFRSNSNHEL